MIRRFFGGVIFMVIMLGWVSSQSPMIPENGLSQHIIDRIDILYGSEVFTSLANYRRKDAFELATKHSFQDYLSDLDSKDLHYLFLDNNEWMAIHQENSALVKHYADSTRMFYTLKNERLSTNQLDKTTRKPVLKYFYRTPANFWEIDEANIKLRVNPVINFQLGKEDGNNNLIFQNTRGVNIRAHLDDKMYVFTNILESQARFYNYHEGRINRFRAIPGNGLFKSYSSRVSDNISGWDFLNAQAYVGMQVSSSVNIELGHARHQIGNGMRSLLLSNWVNNYFYLKFNTKVWKFHYQNIFAELAPISDSYNPANTLLPKKYMANHYLAFKPTKNFEIGIYEAVIFSRQNHFELQYLNPVILYRSVEQFLDSPDNVLIGLNAKWNLYKRTQFYGQVIFDEFKLNELTSGTGWWANKYGIQMGVKYLNLANIDHLDLQVEYNTVTPYTYSHRDTLTTNPNFALASYTHYNQPLAHPLGSNFREYLLSLRYQIGQELFFRGRLMRSSHGDDPPGENWGGNVLAPHTTRQMNFGNELLQGARTDVNMLTLDISYQIFHNYFLDFNFLYRNSESRLPANDLNTTYFGGGLRINLGKRDVDY